MIAFKQIRADAEAGVYEIRYRDLPTGTFIHHDEARRYAAARGLAFPDDLPSLLAAS